jgi:hypothetical protein
VLRRIITCSRSEAVACDMLAGRPIDRRGALASARNSA